MKNEVKIKIEGFNLNRIIDYLISKNILLTNLKINKKLMTFFIKKCDLIWLDKICKFEHKRYLILHEFGVVNFLKSLHNYLGCFLAIIVTVIYIYSFGSRIFKINILNSSQINFDLNLVADYLKRKDIDVGVNKYNISNKKLENEIVNNIDGVSGCFVGFNGGVLNVEIYPKNPKEEVNKIGLYSKFDAVISEIDVYSGSSNYSVGDVVKLGDLIVSSNENVDAKVKGKVYFSSTKIYNQRKQNKVFSGKYTLLRNVNLFNINLIKSRNTCNYSKYLEKNCVFYLFDKYLIPIKINETYCFEYDILEEFVEFEKVETEIKKQLYDEVILKIPEKAEIENCTYSIVKEGDLVRIDCYVEAIVDLV